MIGKIRQFFKVVLSLPKYFVAFCESKKSAEIKIANHCVRLETQSSKTPKLVYKKAVGYTKHAT
jgi:hypothetical protein